VCHCGLDRAFIVASAPTARSDASGKAIERSIVPIRREPGKSWHALATFRLAQGMRWPELRAHAFRKTIYQARSSRLGPAQRFAPMRRNT